MILKIMIDDLYKPIYSNPKVYITELLMMNGEKNP